MLVSCGDGGVRRGRKKIKGLRDATTTDTNRKKKKKEKKKEEEKKNGNVLEQETLSETSQLDHDLGEEGGDEEENQLANKVVVDFSADQSVGDAGGLEQKEQVL